MYVFVCMCVCLLVCVSTSCVCVFYFFYVCVEGGRGFVDLEGAGKRTYIMSLIPPEMKKMVATQVSASPCPYHGTASCHNS